ncbi:MAG: Rrf2 family transcriptional regulator [Treponema sp.]|nr:Rrf2 family transcriptional regulator [Treponema sp.]
MYKISTRGQYALLIMTDLAELPENTFIPLKILSHRRNLSVKYLEQILIQLSKAGLVTGSRGNNGGYRLIKPAHAYSAGEILRALEGDLAPASLSDSNYFSSAGNKSFWQEFEDNINHFVDSISLQELVDRNNASPDYEYCI